MRIDLRSRYTAAFGFVASGVGGRIGNEITTNLLKGDTDKNRVYVWDNKTKFDEVLLYRDNNGAEEKFNFAFESINGDYSGIFATPPMMSLKRSKKLTITPINDSDVEVVERYATEPWQIDWRGLLIDLENHEFPLDKMETLRRIFDYNGVWNVASEILQAVGVNAVFIQDISFDFVEGYEDTISYTMTLSSIKPLEYQLINN